jgi:dATP pyrophosphohydrolase
VPAFKSSHVEVYVFRRRRRVEFLALRRAAGRSLPGVWQPVTGSIRRNERALAAAAREVREETGLTPLRWWAIESPTLFFDAAADAIEALPLFAAEVAAGAQPRLSDEHDALAFLSARAAGARFLWEAQRRGLEAVAREVLAGGALARALEVTPRARGSQPTPTPLRRRRAARPGSGRTRKAAAPARRGIRP